jgi:iron complex outermembrane receptor protein
MNITCRHLLVTGASLTLSLATHAVGAAESATSIQIGTDTPVQLPVLSVEGAAPAPVDGSAEAGYRVQNADFGPLGSKKVADAPYSITAIPADLMEAQQAKNISDVIKYNPSAQIEPRGDLDFGRPQTRGFENSSTQNTRIDGLNSYTIMAYPMENYGDLEILNGAAGAFYGASSPGGTFNFVSKRPTDLPVRRLTLGYDSQGMFSEHAEVSGQAGNDGMFGYRINALHGDGESYVAHSNVERELLSGDFDVRITDSTKLELDVSSYTDNESGLPNAFVYGSTFKLPHAPDPTRVGYGVVNSGQTLTDGDVGLRLKHEFNANWKMDLGGMYQNFSRTKNPTGPYGAADAENLLTSGSGNYSSIISDTALKGEVDSDLAYLNGHVQTGGLTHDLVLGTNGYQQITRTRIGQSYILGNASFSDPVLYYAPTYSNLGTFYKSGYSGQQALVTGDTVTFDEHWSVLAVASQSWLTSVSYNAAGKTTANYNAYGISPTASLIYKPVSNITTYFTYADALQQGDTAPTSGVANPGVVLAPYRSQQFEVGGKASVRDSLDLSAAIFHMTRPYAYTDPADDTFKANGQQANDGIELTAKGNVVDALTVFGGVTYLDPMLKNTGNAGTTDKLVVSVPKYQANVFSEYRVPEVSGLSLNMNAHYTGRRAANVTNTTWAESYATLDLGARYVMNVYGRDVTWRGGVNNVTDQRYWAAILPETQSGGSSQAGAGSTVYAAFMGAPRTIHLSMSVDF